VIREKTFNKSLDDVWAACVKVLVLQRFQVKLSKRKHSILLNDGTTIKLKRETFKKTRVYVRSKNETISEKVKIKIKREDESEWIEHPITLKIDTFLKQVMYELGLIKYKWLQ
jgi:hypothetical protein